MSWDGGGGVRYRRKPGHDGATGPTFQPEERFDAAELLARFARGDPRAASGWP